MTVISQPDALEDKEVPRHRQQTRLGLRRIYILPTRYGLIFAAVLVIMLLGSANYNSSLGYVLTFLLGSLSLVCLLHTYRNLAGISLNGGRVDAVFAGQVAHFKLTIDNREGHQRYGLSIKRRQRRRTLRQWLFSPAAEIEDWQGEIEARQIVNLPVDITSTRRGSLSLGRLEISTSFPLGLFRAWSSVDPRLTCVVYPVPEGGVELPFDTGSRASGQAGQQEGVDDFIGFREYYPGDSPRYIAWKSYARDNNLLIKRFSGTGSEQVNLSWDKLFFLPDPEARLSQLCQWVLSAESQGLIYRLSLPHHTITAGSGSSHQDQCLRQLALFET